MCYFLVWFTGTHTQIVSQRHAPFRLFQYAQTQLFTEVHTNIAQAKKYGEGIHAVHNLFAPFPVAHNLDLIGVAPLP